MDGITKELAAKAAEFYKVSDQNREVWMAGFAAGYLGGKAAAFCDVSSSCSDYAKKIVDQIKSGTAEEFINTFKDLLEVAKPLL